MCIYIYISSCLLAVWGQVLHLRVYYLFLSTDRVREGVLVFTKEAILLVLKTEPCAYDWTSNVHPFGCTRRLVPPYLERSRGRCVLLIEVMGWWTQNIKHSDVMLFDRIFLILMTLSSHHFLQTKHQIYMGVADTGQCFIHISVQVFMYKTGAHAALHQRMCAKCDLVAWWSCTHCINSKSVQPKKHKMQHLLYEGVL